MAHLLLAVRFQATRPMATPDRFPTCLPHCTACLQVMRELSDRVVEWQLAHQDVSRGLVGANMRMAELQTEHDRLTSVIKNLMAQNEQHTRAHASPAMLQRTQPPRPISSGKHARLQGFFGRLKTPRG
jgi:hypothetical protein